MSDFIRIVKSLAPNKVKPTEAAAPHTHYDIQTIYSRVEGQLLVPSGAGPVIVRTSAPYGEKIVIWVARRVGALPLLPSSEPKDSNEVLYTKDIGTAAPGLMPDGQTGCIMVSGVYRYWLKTPPSDEGGYAMGTLPFDKTPPNLNVIGKAQFGKVF